MEVSIESPGNSRISPKTFHLTRMPAVSEIQIPHEVARRLAQWQDQMAGVYSRLTTFQTSIERRHSIAIRILVNSND
jgi:hypothetical protein